MNLTWTVHPFKSDQKKSFFLIAFIILIALLVYFSFSSIVFMLLSIVLLVLAMRQYFIPTHYTLDDEGAKVSSISSSKTRPWDYFKSYYYDRNGVLLSPFETKSPLESFRGIYLILPPDKREPILEFIKTKIKIDQSAKLEQV